MVIFSLAAGVLAAQDTQYPPDGSQLPGPGRRSTPEWVEELSEWETATQIEHDSWLRDLKQWRHERLIRMGYDDAEYRRPELLWTQRNFIQPQMMAEERFFYDPAAGKYTVDRYLDDVDKRYGGIDSLLIWPVYPNIGIDNRNQWDLARDLPGGIPALRQMVEDFHRRGVRVFFPSMPWDTGTRDVGVPYWKATAQLMFEIGADGVNGDTFDGMPRAYRTASDQTGHPVAFEPEGSPRADEMLMWNNQSWGYWKFPFAPMVSKLKWLEPRHMINVCDRWARDKTDNLQAAFFNGVGYESWENIWGIWNEITPRDAEALRRVAYIERQFADLLISKAWEPYAPGDAVRRVREPLSRRRPDVVDDGEPERIRDRRRADGNRASRRDALFRYLAWRGTASQGGGRQGGLGLCDRGERFWRHPGGDFRSGQSGRRACSDAAMVADAARRAFPPNGSSCRSAW